MSPKILGSVEGGIALIKSGVIPEGMLAGVLPTGGALYAGTGRTPVLRPTGPREPGVTIAPVALGCYGSPAEEAKAMRQPHGGRRQRKQQQRD
jgi:hypothetical protein